MITKTKQQRRYYLLCVIADVAKYAVSWPQQARYLLREYRTCVRLWTEHGRLTGTEDRTTL